MSSKAVLGAFPALLATLDAFVIVNAAVLTSSLYHGFRNDPSEAVGGEVTLALLIVALYVGQNLLHGVYRFRDVLSEKFNFPALLRRWIYAFFIASVLAFVTRSGGEMSRVATLLFFGVGAASLLATSRLAAHGTRELLRNGAVSLNRVFLVGYEEEIKSFTERYKPWSLGMEIVTAAVLRNQETIAEDLQLATATARIFQPDDVFILLPWHEVEAIEACVETFLGLPTSVHLGPDRILERFNGATLDKVGPISSIRLVRSPLNGVELMMKRAFDLVAAGCGLALLAPLFALVALAIKLESPGPVFFRQRRYGFNQQPFSIFKFRSMTWLKEGADLRQATRNDARVTRVGRFIRRTNIDELPQLINVLLGQMSLVGPRPHIMAHDQMLGRVVSQAARRHNVKPGITGWAQAHGFRGELDSGEKLRGRIEHDLYYIDHWSLWLDIRILFLTLFSRQAYRNAY
ncbi:Undecaprenyl-phosphate glucose phosphotransferase [Rhodoblastus acidophilus]|uniref:exopolysaccharide biosynthesis polyprenyl glycosylphosphotransferase n=1 Tax=Rhodoblastus acidophilus TaxID=1074 RepID=UPI00222453C9|nr:exopolysaccharide biosynthesis polyprenyl glycosylphosphotransferase [Rhodoblastus acidophilus]MCW2283763.1 Undecaprenyl-phosphate glucose phosphotransferase [Rhodoblastus acidophilus]MCW2332888.1 Undecaprenyl-phosphate glucose phosphotransferase [Rhodoblastus acidophilus]